MIEPNCELENNLAIAVELGQKLLARNQLLLEEQASMRQQLEERDEMIRNLKLESASKPQFQEETVELAQFKKELEQVKAREQELVRVLQQVKKDNEKLKKDFEAEKAKAADLSARFDESVKALSKAQKEAENLESENHMLARRSSSRNNSSANLIDAREVDSEDYLRLTTLLEVESNQRWKLESELKAAKLLNEENSAKILSLTKQLQKSENAHSKEFSNSSFAVLLQETKRSSPFKGESEFSSSPVTSAAAANMNVGEYVELKTQVGLLQAAQQEFSMRFAKLNDMLQKARLASIAQEMGSQKQRQSVTELFQLSSARLDAVNMEIELVRLNSNFSDLPFAPLVFDFLKKHISLTKSMNVATLELQKSFDAQQQGKKI